jgi:hypothetical protein
MSAVNLFAFIPLEILENEILSRLDLVGTVSLLIATRVTVSAAARPVIFIRWKYLAAEGAPSLTLTNTVREQLLIRVYMDIFKSTPALLNNNFAYASLEGLLHGETVEPRNFNRIPRDTLYPMAVAVAGPRLPELMNILRVKFPEAYEKINDVLALRRGEFPSMHRADSIINDYSPRYGIPPKTYVRYIAECAADYRSIRSRVSSMLCYADDAAKYGIDIPELFLATSEAGAILNCDWSKVPESVYRSAVTSGYLWFLAGVGIPMHKLSDTRWEILVVDFSSRTAESPPSRIVDAIWGVDREDVLLRRLPEITKLFTRNDVMRLAITVDKPAIYMRLRTIMGDSLFETVLFDACRNGRPATVWICSGGGYIERLRDGPFVRDHMIGESLRVNNAKFLRGFILSGEKLPPRLHAECIASGHVECVKVAREFALPITQEDLERTLAKGNNLAIVNLYI